MRQCASVRSPVASAASARGLCCLRAMRLILWNWDAERVRFIFEGLSKRAAKALRREIDKIFRKTVVKLADVQRLARGGGYPFTDEDLEPLLGLHPRLRFFPYWITGSISGLRRRAGMWGPLVLIKMTCGALDGERRAPRSPSHSPARVGGI